MTRLMPSPLGSLILAAIWLLLNQSLSPGQLLLAVVFGLSGPLLLKQLDVPALQVRRPLAVLRLAQIIVVDVVRSNIAVSGVLLRSNKGRRSGFVRIPLQLQSPYALTALACIITATPGTSWVTHDSDSGILVIHVLDLVEGDDWIATIKGRYERLLMEIFE